MDFPFSPPVGHFADRCSTRSSARTATALYWPAGFLRQPIASVYLQLDTACSMGGDFERAKRRYIWGVGELVNKLLLPLNPHDLDGAFRVACGVLALVDLVPKAKSTAALAAAKKKFMNAAHMDEPPAELANVILDEFE